MKKSDLSEFGVEEENFKLKIRRDTGKEAQPHIVNYAPAQTSTPATQSEPISQAAPAAQAASIPQAESDSGVYITSPMVGTFYTSSSPENPAYVKVGDTVSAD